MLELTREKYINEILDYFNESPQLALRMIETVGGRCQGFVPRWISEEEFSAMIKAFDEITLDDVPQEIIRDDRGCARLVGVADADGFRSGEPPFESPMWIDIHWIKLKNGKQVLAQYRLHDRLWRSGEYMAWTSLDSAKIFLDKEVVGWRPLVNGG